MIKYKEESSGIISTSLYQPAECKAIVAELQRLKDWEPARVREAQDTVNYEVLTRSDVRSASTLVSDGAAKFYHDFNARLDASIKPLIKQHWQLDLVTHSGTHVVRYGTADHYVPHLDTGPGLEYRYFSVVCYLNDDFTGGQTLFPGLNHIAIPQSGKAMVFPSNFLHGSEPVTSGEKFVVVSWINGPVPVNWI